MKEIKAEFRQRARAIVRYMRMLKVIDAGSYQLTNRAGTPGWRVDITTTHMLKAGVYLHLYNLTEATVRSCLVRTAEEIQALGLTFSDLNDDWQESWLRSVGRHSEPLNPENRLENLFDIARQVASATIVSYKPRLTSGNVDDRRIEELLMQHGIELKIDKRLYADVRRPVLDKMGPLELVRRRRNELAHGLDSFDQCGQSVTVVQLGEWAITVIKYLRAVILRCEDYMLRRGFT